MIDSKKIKQMVEHVARRSRGVEDRELMYPMREWAIGMAISTIIVAVGALVSYYFYREAINLADMQVTPVAPTVPYDAQKISDAINKYDDKLQAYRVIVEGGNFVPAPVIEEVEEVVPEEMVSEDDSLVEEESTDVATTSEETEVEGEEIPPEVFPETQLRSQ